ncbi:MAG: TlpA family protein disulfide reductase [Bacteroidota bacterium]|nr:TlpA family protein disulfide reductase [Bacteroidota bacterium]
MKKLLLSLPVIALLLIQTSVAQDTPEKSGSLPAVNVKALDGSVFSTDKITNDGKPIILSFWATWCKPCVMEMNAIAELYADWQAETGVKFVAISIDDARSATSVAPFVNGKGWDFEVYLDPNGDFKRAMNVNTVPHTFLLNGKLEVVNQHTSFAPGDEEKLYELVKKLAAGLPLN